MQCGGSRTHGTEWNVIIRGTRVDSCLSNPDRSMLRDRTWASPSGFGGWRGEIAQRPSGQCLVGILVPKKTTPSSKINRAVGSEIWSLQSGVWGLKYQVWGLQCVGRRWVGHAGWRRDKHESSYTLLELGMAIFCSRHTNDTSSAIGTVNGRYKLGGGTTLGLPHTDAGGVSPSGIECASSGQIGLVLWR